MVSYNTFTMTNKQTNNSDNSQIVYRIQVTAEPHNSQIVTDSAEAWRIFDGLNKFYKKRIATTRGVTSWPKLNAYNGIDSKLADYQLISVHPTKKRMSATIVTLTAFTAEDHASRDLLA